MPYENPDVYPFDVEEDKKIVGVVTAKDPQNINPVVSQRPMILQMPMMQQLQTNQMPFPLIFFLFPRIAMLLTMRQGGGYGPKRMGIQNITQIVRDSNGYIKEIVEFVK
jgi:hypothetical protein